jgi:hypothetical protein
VKTHFQSPAYETDNHDEHSGGEWNIPELEYVVDSSAFSTLADTHLGKNIIISNRQSWDDSRIIKAYRSQFIIENVFKEMKDRTTGSWWPLNHWTDSKIRVHGLYCTIAFALLLMVLMLRRAKAAGITLSMNNEAPSVGAGQHAADCQHLPKEASAED